MIVLPIDSAIRIEATRIARETALEAGRHGMHGYLPTTEEEAATWLPHPWVIYAISKAIMEHP